MAPELFKDISGSLKDEARHLSPVPGFVFKIGGLTEYYGELADEKSIIHARDLVLAPSHHILIPEAGAIFHPKEKTGFIVRDLSPLDKKKLYIPGHGISSAGKLISDFHRQDFDSFWEENYIIPLAKQNAISRSIDNFLKSETGQKALYKYKQEHEKEDSSIVHMTELISMGL